MARQKDRPTADAQIIAALRRIHRLSNDGSVGNSEPAMTVEIAKASGVTKATVSKFLKRTLFFGNYKGYMRSCRDNKIGFHLRMLMRELDP